MFKIWENPPDCSSGRLRPARASSDRLGPARDPNKSISGVKIFYCWDGWFPNRWFRMFLSFLPLSIFLNRLRVWSAAVARTPLVGPTRNNEDLWRFHGESEPILEIRTRNIMFIVIAPQNIISIPNQTQNMLCVGNQRREHDPHWKSQPNTGFYCKANPKIYLFSLQIKDQKTWFQSKIRAQHMNSIVNRSTKHDCY